MPPVSTLAARLRRLRSDAELGDLLGKSGRVLAIQGGGLVVAFLTQILLVRLLGGATGYGIFAWGRGLAVLLATIACFGIPKTAMRFLAETGGGSQRGRAVERRAARLLGVTSSITLAAAAVGVLLWRELGLPLERFGLAALLLALACAAPAAFVRLGVQLARARQWVVAAYLPPHLLRPLLLGGVAAALWVVGGRALSSEGALTALLAATAGVLALQSLWLRRLRRRESSVVAENVPPEPLGADSPPPAMVPVALPIFVSTSLGELIEQAGVLILGILAAPADAAVYRVAFRLAALGAMPLLLVNAVAAPLYVRLHAAGDRAGLQRAVSRTAHLAFWPTLAAGLLLAAGGRTALGLFGPEFEAGRPVLLLLIAAQVARVAFGPTRVLLNMTGHQTDPVPVLAAGAALIVALDVWLVPGLGAMGAALATTATLALVTVSHWALVRWRLRLDPTVLPLRVRGRG